MMDYRLLAEDLARDAFQRGVKRSAAATVITHLESDYSRYAKCGKNLNQPGHRLLAFGDEPVTCPDCRQFQIEDDEYAVKLGLR